MTTKPQIREEVLLIKESRDGDHAAFKKLYELNVSPLYRFMSQFSADQEQVRDWVQRAFIKAYENLSTFDGISLFATWLFKIALNEMRMDLRRAKVIPFVPAQDEDHPDIASEDESFEWNMAMRLWLGQLDETKRAVFLLYEVEGYSHSEIADMLHIRESASRTILTRTKRFLRKRWEEERKVV